jgi:hypothetical protein
MARDYNECIKFRGKAIFNFLGELLVLARLNKFYTLLGAFLLSEWRGIEK